MIQKRFHTPPSSNSGFVWGILVFLVVSVAAVYWPVTSHEFIIFDDNIYVYENRYVRPGPTLDGLIWAIGLQDKEYLTLWHPLTKFSHMLDCYFFGLNAGMHHSMNVFFHLLNTLALFFILKRMTGSLWKSAIVSALFGLHPMNVESVAWVAQRKNVLSTFFWMLSMRAYIAYTDRPGLGRYLLVFMFLTVGLTAKPILVTLPVVFLLLDYWPLKRIGMTAGDCESVPAAGEKSVLGFSRSVLFLRVVEKMPFLVLSALSILLSTASTRSVDTSVSLENVPLSLRIANALVSLVAYIGKILWPDHLAVFYPFPKHLPMWEVVGSAALLLLISVLVILTYRRKPYGLLGWMWYLVTMLPVLGLIQTGLWPAMADRWVYVPGIGLFIMVIWGVEGLAKSLPHPKLALGALGGAVLMCFSVTARTQVGYWSDNVSLFQHALDVTRENEVMHGNLGIVLADRGQVAEAIEQHTRVLELNPRNPDAHNNLGNALVVNGKTAEAIRHYTEALQIQPDHPKAHVNIGNAYARTGRPDKARQHFEAALRIDPNLKDGHYNFGVLLFEQGALAEAIDHFNETLRIDPYFAKAYNNLGAVMTKQGRTEQAKAFFREAMRLSPDFDEPRENLKQLTDARKQVDLRVSQVLDALKARPEDPDLHFELGNLYKSTGDLDKAIKAYESVPENSTLYVLSLENRAVAFAMKGNYDQAVEMLHASIEREPDRPDTCYYLAGIHARQHRVETAVYWLRRAIDNGYRNRQRIRTDPNLNDIRRSPEFQVLLERLDAMK